MAERHIELWAFREGERWAWSAVSFDAAGKAMASIWSRRTYATRRGAIRSARLSLDDMGAMRIEVLDG